VLTVREGLTNTGLKQRSNRNDNKASPSFKSFRTEGHQRNIYLHGPTTNMYHSIKVCY